MITRSSRLKEEQTLRSDVWFWAIIFDEIEIFSVKKIQFKRISLDKKIK